MTLGRRALVLLVLLGAGPRALVAQAGDGVRADPDGGIRPVRAAASWWAEDAALPQAPAPRWRGGVPPRPASSPWSRGAWPVALSAVLPGTGQLALDRRRGWVYLGVEAAAWIWYADRRGAADSFRTAYRDHAWEGARTWEGPRVDGDFDYYERLARWARSGAYDGDVGAPGVQPETDPTTYNGSIWARAQGLFMPPGARGTPGEPGYEEAVAYYRDRAYDEALLWDWSGDPAAREAYGALIDASDLRARQATAALGVILTNHLLSAIDAFLTTRGLSARAGIGAVPDGPPARSPRFGDAPRGPSSAAAAARVARSLLARGGDRDRGPIGHVPPAGAWHLIISWRTP